MVSKTSYQTESDQLLAAVTQHNKDAGASLLEVMDSASTLLLAWLQYLDRYARTSVADELLTGVRSAVIEAAGVAALGLVRPGLLSLRAEIDLLLSWLYYKDHAKEWALANEGGFFKLKSELVTYLNNTMPGFQERYNLLLKVADRSQKEPYVLLSKHVHSQTAALLPPGGKVASLVANVALCHEFVKLQREVSEYLGDLLASYYAGRWSELPTSITEYLEARLGDEGCKRLVTANAVAGR